MFQFCVAKILLQNCFDCDQTGVSLKDEVELEIRKAHNLSDQQSLLKLFEIRLQLRAPLNSCDSRQLLQAVTQMFETRHQITVIAAQLEEESQLTSCAWERPLLNAIQLVLLRLNARIAKDVSQVVNAPGEQCSL